MVNPADILKTDKMGAALIYREPKDGWLSSITVPDSKKEGGLKMFISKTSRAGRRFS